MTRVKQAVTLGPRSFAAGWVAWSAVAWGIIGTFSATAEFNNLPMLAQVGILFGAAGLLLPPMQAILLRRRLGTLLQHFIRDSSAAWVLGSLGIYLLLRNSMTSELAGQMVFALIFAVPAIVQMRLLGRHMEPIWPWGLVGAVSGFLLVMPLAGMGYEVTDRLWIAFATGGGLVGLAQVGVLRWMMDAGDRKRKAAEATRKQRELSTAEVRLLPQENAPDLADTPPATRAEHEKG